MLVVILCLDFGLILNFWIYSPIPLGGRGREVVTGPWPPVQTSSFASLGTRDFMACNHLRSYKYYSESILNPKGFTAYPCACYRDFESVRCYTTLSPMVVLLSCYVGVCSTLHQFLIIPYFFWHCLSEFTWSEPLRGLEGGKALSRR